MLGKHDTALIVTRSAANCRPSPGNTWRPHPGPGLLAGVRSHGVRQPILVELDRVLELQADNHRGAAAGRRRPAVGRVPPALAWGDAAVLRFCGRG